MSARFADPVFASSQEVRRVANEPLGLTLIRFGLDVPAPLDEAIKGLSASNPALYDTGPYFNEVCPEVESTLQAAYPHVPKDSLKMMRTYTLEIPPYYRETSTNLYAYDYERKELSEHYVTMVGHFNIGIQKLASSQANPSELVRVAWIPKSTFDAHFKENNKVVFRAPMSTATVLQSQFLEKPASFQANHVPCVLVFDKEIAKRAGQLCNPLCPISVFGGSEDEWVLPAFTRGAVNKIEEYQCPHLYPSGLTTTSGQKVLKVMIKGFPEITPDPACMVGSNEAILRGALLLGLSSSVGKDDNILLQCVRDLCASLAQAVDVNDPTSFDSKLRELSFFSRVIEPFRELIQIFAQREWRGLTMRWEDVGERTTYTQRELRDRRLSNQRCKAGRLMDRYSGYMHVVKEASKAVKEGWKTLQHEANEKRKALLTKLNLTSVPHEQLSRAIDQISLNTKNLPATLESQLASYGDSDSRVIAWACLLSIAEYLSLILSNDAEVASLFQKPYPPCLTSELQPLDAMVLLEHTLWTPPVSSQTSVASCRFATEASAMQMYHAWRSAAQLDIMRISLSTTRVLIVMGSPDAGKTTFLNSVFKLNLPAGRGEESRTHTCAFYKHPLFNDCCQAYVADSPGFGDAVQGRNDAVRLVSECASVMPATAKVVWVTEASRALESVADNLFKVLLPVCPLIVVTKIDKLVEELERDMFQKLEGRVDNEPDFDFDFDDEVLMKSKRMELMKTAKVEVEGHLTTLCDDEPCPRIIYMALASDSWACTEPSKTRRKVAPPWPTAKSDLTDFFQLSTADETYNRTNAIMNIA